MLTSIRLPWYTIELKSLHDMLCSISVFCVVQESRCTCTLYKHSCCIQYWWSTDLFHTHIHTHTPCSDDSDTKQLLQDATKTYDYGSSSSLTNEPQIKPERRERTQRRPWPDVSRLLSLAAFWKQRRAQPQNRRIDINREFPSEGHKFCSNRIRCTRALAAFILHLG